ncbi:MAG: 16S rRNA (adenine(1518)-N(6)/adenine(1519)-N(6))-dimethyltransferase RsmA [Saprospiraceae bacterium]|nr:16S rRNA (adenine(1518)-N(6)/adenine(1519)-N(6))-dimethyltransferase RsmA [Saprospiraceae bacterium]
MKAKKSFGQHFLIDEHIAEKIANGLLKVEGFRNVLEIGPGKGVLTKYLSKHDTQLKVVEADQDMVDFLTRNKIIDPDQIILLDFLKLNLSKVFGGQQFYMIGNYPYNISSQILFKMINSKELVPEMVGMFQKEVADRVVAPPGSKTYGVISVLVQAYYTGETIIDVGPNAFNPPPKVNSSVIRLKRKENFELSCDDRLFRTVVKTSFSQRRKMLRNTLKPLVQDIHILEDPFFTQRPEQLGVAEFVDITNRIKNQKKND